MNLSEEKYVRFEDCDSEKSFSLNSTPRRGLIPIRKPRISSIIDGIRSGVSRSSKRIKSLRNWSLHGYYYSPSNSKPTKMTKILDPQEPFLQRWNKIFVLACIVAVSLDPLFFYIPVVDGERRCLSLDKRLQIIACVLRTFIDFFYVFHIYLQFRTGFIARYTMVFGRGELIVDPKAIAKRYLSFYFIIDVLSIVPLPQVVILAVIPWLHGPISLVTKDLVKAVIFVQYVPRVWRIYPLYEEVTRTSGIFTETAWAGAAFNLLLYMLASHTIGAIWYMIAVERRDRCWRQACRHHGGCNLNDLYCGGVVHGNTSFLSSYCPLLEPDKITSPNEFDFGIFLDALQSQVVEHRDFPKKLLYCFWWGLRNLSSLGQNLKTSTFVGEILFAIFISIVGLVLFSLLIGNMQKYLQSITVRVEEMRVKRRDAEQWMSHRMLPEDLRARIRRYEQYKWQQNRGVDEYSLIRNLPKDLRRDIKRHLCWTLLTRVPMFQKMNEQLLDAMCHHLKPILYTKDSYIVREGDPVDEMLFIMRGKIYTMTTNGGQTGFFNSTYLKAGDFCGEELLTWALDPNSSTTLPISTRTVRAVKDVEAFCLMPEDLKSVASQFRRLFQGKQLQHIFRSSSPQWRTWGACFIQAAWRRHCKQKIEKSLQEAEDMLKNQLPEGGNTTSLGATIYASRFATHMLGNLKRNRPHINTKPSTTRLSPLLPQKPAEPDFSAQNRS
ncbi:Cyclic nucleotide-gated ion channel 1 [Striga hermonthica]|uniref:Cyclic nucleotide-gated ion channel 1 n=1 Tax=Striga hermonthica TaxID=68872 RepID=A0A9N7NI97_STRHE|nr:Cyclic nucleotide-gated ion channel 1 [Striga hermonthica]